jgi:protein TonB
MGYQALLFCPDEKAARGVTQVLSELDFTVEPCTEPFAAVKKLMAQHFDAIVVDCDNEQNATLLFKSARNSSSNQSSLAVAVVEGQAGVAKAFRIGANLVLTKPINIEQAKGTLRVARGLLRKGGDAVKPTTDASTPAATSTTVSTPTPAASVAKASPAPRPAPANPAPGAPSQKAWPSAPRPTAPARPTQPDDRRAGTGSTAVVADASPKIEAPPKLPPKPAPAAQPAAAQTKYPWQASKPAGEPMASALKKAAEAAGIPTTNPVESSSPALAEISTTSSANLRSAAAPAPAREKAPAPVPVAPVITKPAIVEPPQPEIAEQPVVEHKAFAEPEVAPPSFSMGAPAVDEEEPASSKKAFIIIAIVLILAGMAGYLAWKNMSSKPSSAPASQVTVPAPAQTAPAASANVTDVPASSTTVAPSSVSTPEPPVSAPPSKPSGKIIAKDSTSTVSSTAPASQPAVAEDSTAAPALVVHHENSRSTPKASSTESESAPAPSALGLTPTADPNALAAIGNAPVAVPKASNQVVKVSQGVSEGLVLKKVQPRYPAQALQMHTEGSVQLQATIGKDGSISNLKVLNGEAILARAALEAVKQWKYKPYYLNGDPVEIQTQITINFKLPR